ncbi:DUF1257 domain-containing protein [Gloeobacter morelensis]|uniref:DUF1257 domain-containing protein n=1 Tax=Gloeobacter morelensis MG652769 TaxID=2781736 RepID=A0ABY3PHT4_9CYAN|nr:DUF1257 domain-containing protein [Gloeobacter morelensis]UFP93197.1 DUF1257 domain-containing protein [Gloeobacter morelensis MG652769]
MSHFTQIKTRIRNLDSLEKALGDLQIAAERGNVSVRGYRGETRPAQLVIRQDNGHDVGFVWNGQEYEMVTDVQFWQQPWTVERFLGKVSQRYALHTVLAESAPQGFNLVTQENREDGTMRLVLQRWSA